MALVGLIHFSLKFLALKMLKGYFFPGTLHCFQYEFRTYLVYHLNGTNVSGIYVNKNELYFGGVYFR